MNPLTMDGAVAVTAILHPWCSATLVCNMLPVR
jgi:hypothetical protein